MNRIIIIAILWGVFGAFAIASVFFFIMALAASWKEGWAVFNQLAGWVVPLILGFGIQVGLFAYMKLVLAKRKAELASGATTASVSTAGGMSAMSMVACCAHHLTDVVPFLGISALSLFVTEFQQTFLALGLASNIIGITMMLKTISEHELYGEGSFLSKMRFLNMKIALIGSIVLGLLLFLGVLLKNLISSGGGMYEKDYHFNPDLASGLVCVQLWRELTL